MRETFVAALKDLAAMERGDLQKSTRPGQVIYSAAGLAEWDKHVAKSLSPETSRRSKLMFSLQQPSGTWGSADCWPPYESDAFHEATVAVIAIADAPGWLAGLKDPALRTGVERLENYCGPRNRRTTTDACFCSGPRPACRGCSTKRSNMRWSR